MTVHDPSIERALTAAQFIEDPRRRLHALLSVFPSANGTSSAIVAELNVHELSDGSPKASLGRDLLVVEAAGADALATTPGTLLPVSTFIETLLGTDPQDASGAAANDIAPSDLNAVGWVTSGDANASGERDIALEAAFGHAPYATGRALFSAEGTPVGVLLIASRTGRAGAELDGLLALTGLHIEATLVDLVGQRRSSGESTEIESQWIVDQRLRTIEERYRRFIALTGEAIWCLDMDPPIHHRATPSEVVEGVLRTGRFSEANATFVERFQAETSSVVEGRLPTDLAGFWLTQDLSKLERLAEDRFSANDISATEIDSLGRVRYLRCSVFGLVDARGLTSLWGIERDVTAEAEENQVLRESEELYKAISRTALDGICVLDSDLAVLDCNDAFAELVGQSREDVINDGRCRILPGPPDAVARRRFDSIKIAGSWRGEAALERADLTHIPVELACRHTDVGRGRFYCFVRDLSARRLAERRERDHQHALAEVSRLSTLGEMASGIAHEFNQPLAAIVNYANGCVRLLEQQSYEDPNVLGALRAIADQGKRASEIIRRLRSFSRRGEENREPFILSELLTDAIELTAQSRLRAGIRIDTDFMDGNDEVVVDGIQIEQVVMNLLLNAAAAVDRNAGAKKVAEPVEGHIEVTTRATAAGPGFSSPGTVEVTVRDNGAGLSEEDSKRLFEPFYSGNGQGLGLGLTIGQSIVESHGGRLWLDLAEVVEADSSHGACFRFTLPVRRG